MKGTAPVEPASAFIDEKIKELGDWRGKTLAKVREIIHQADPDIVEEWKWVRATNPETPVWSHGGIVCTGETYKNVVKMTFAKGAALQDPSRLFNSSLEGNVRRAIDIHEGENIDEAALRDLIRAAVALNLKGKTQVSRLNDLNAATLFLSCRIRAITGRDVAVFPVHGQRGLRRLKRYLGDKMSVGAQMVVVLKAFVQRCVALVLRPPFGFSW